MDNKTMLGTAPIGKLLFRLALPTVVAQMVNMLYNVVDRMFIGHMSVNGDLALTGVGVCMPIILLVSAFSCLVGSGGAPRASIFMGKKDMESAERTLGGCFTAQVVVSFILTAVLLIWNRPILLAFGASENTIDYASGYMTVYAIGTLFVQLTLGMNAFITAQGFTKISMLSVVIGAAANIALDPLFIYAFDMGVEGAALATIISQALSCAWVLLFLCGKKTILRLKKEYLRLDAKVVLPSFALGFAAFVMQSSESVIFVCFNSSLLKYGGDIAVGAMTILSSAIQMVWLPINGIAQGAQPISSYNYGAGNAERVRRTFRLLLISCTAVSFAVWLAVMLFPRTLASMYTSDKALLDFTVPALRIYMGATFMFGMQTACQMTFVAMGYALTSAIVAAVRKFGLLLPLIYIVPHLVNDPTTGVYMAEPIADFIAVCFTVTLFSIQFRKAMRKIENINAA